MVLGRVLRISVQIISFCLLLALFPLAWFPLFWDEKLRSEFFNKEKYTISRCQRTVKRGEKKKDYVCLFCARVCPSQSAAVLAALLLSSSVQIFPAGRSQISEISVLAVIILSASAALLKPASSDLSGGLTRACMCALLGKLPSFRDYYLPTVFVPKQPWLTDFTREPGLKCQHAPDAADVCAGMALLGCFVVPGFRVCQKLFRIRGLNDTIVGGSTALHVTGIRFLKSHSLVNKKCNNEWISD